jgi:hypothetical protein
MMILSRRWSARVPERVRVVRMRMRRLKMKMKMGRARWWALDASRRRGA